MQDEKTMNLPEEEFHELAKEQSKKFPDLLQFLTEEEIIESFYGFYHRKLKK